ncbi:MAG: class I SAM-dependent methyltransferase [Pseudomonadota bacterium]
MPKVTPFEEHSEQYEDWFTRHRWVYEAELRAVKSLLPEKGRGMEVGVGSGRFAAPLGIKIGVEPSSRLRRIAEERGLQVLDGVAEALPFDEAEFDFVLMVTVVCFVDDVDQSIQEAGRVLKKDGHLLIGLLDRESPLGRVYQKHQGENVFYQEATFFSVDEIVEVMRRAGFQDFQFRQTIFSDPSETTPDEPIRPGYGQGSFVVIRGGKT